MVSYFYPSRKAFCGGLDPFVLFPAPCQSMVEFLCPFSSTNIYIWHPHFRSSSSFPRFTQARISKGVVGCFLRFRTPKVPPHSPSFVSTPTGIQARPFFMTIFDKRNVLLGTSTGPLPPSPSSLPPPRPRAVSLSNQSFQRVFSIPPARPVPPLPAQYRQTLHSSLQSSLVLPLCLYD